MSMIRGVLLAGKFRTQTELNSMSREDRRNTLIVVLTDLTNQTNYQSFDDVTLAGMGAVLVFLRETRIRDDGALKTMSADDQRNTLIVVLDAEMNLGLAKLQGLTNMELVLVGLGSDLASKGSAPGVLSSFIRAVLLAGHFRTLDELKKMSLEDQRNTLIVELTKHSNQTNFQSFSNPVLEGMGAVLVFLREGKIRDDVALRAMSADDQRNTTIAVIGGQTHLGTELQRLSNLDLVLMAFGDNEGVVGESDGMHAVVGVTHSVYAGVFGTSTGGGIGVHGKGGRLAGLFEGDVEVTGDIRLMNADCAEEFSVSGSLGAEPGTVMVLDEGGTVCESGRAYDRRVAGVVSGAGDYRPGIVLDRQKADGGRRPIALLGKVFCKVDASFGAIEVGDLLTTSPTPGYAMKTTDPLRAFGAVLGKALRPLADGQGLIPILVALQ